MLEGYGLSETSPVASFNKPGEVHKPLSIGTPLEEVEMRVVDGEDRDLPAGEVGEILIRGDNVMRGYWNAPEATERVLRGGWLHTGDLGARRRGRLLLHRRPAQGHDHPRRANVYSREVEDVLHEHPAVAEAAIVAVPHPVLGEDVGAAVVLRDGAAASERELRTFVRNEIAAFKYPRHIWFLDALPRNATGKVLKREIAVPPDVIERAAVRRG